MTVILCVGEFDPILSLSTYSLCCLCINDWIDQLTINDDDWLFD